MAQRGLLKGTEWQSGWAECDRPIMCLSSLLLSLASSHPCWVSILLIPLYPLITNNSTLQLVLTTVSTAVLFVIAEDTGTTRALYSMEYSEAVKKNDEDLNVLLGSELQDISFVEENKATTPCRTANKVYYSTCVWKKDIHTWFCTEISRKIHTKLLMTGWSWW